jgi:F0F1-type ATP synthase alpha subunit
MLLDNNYNYNNLLKRGPKIALRAKVNDSIITGIMLVDTILAIGRGQRQLILGDRYTGKTSIFLSLLITSSSSNIIGSFNGLGTQRLFGVYTAINQNLSKLSSIIYSLNSLGIMSYNIIIASHSSSSAMLSLICP